ncbi:hypothetical protein EXM22_02475 [Oceanispirochaeta crateris]|uniref:Uncharacterized protein n=1 Tax=Oceanispirochaeta crateris TaxID=2518645 RepID=A0A5C1QJY8_9SPIO|nr:hypothetical protein [Oceanispirochaeta crateris]QEN06914.1 hypothetical protein EXM22_02475 [Oceanispirochaeta crateris]
MARRQLDAVYFLQFFLGISLFVFGIMALNGYNSTGQEVMRGLNKVFGKSNNLFPIIFGIVQLAAGALLIVKLFIDIDSGIFRIIHLAICILWAISIVMNFFVSNLMEPDLIRWLGALAPQLVILLSLWIVGEER